MKKTKIIELAITGVIIAVVVMLPLISGAKSYPLAVVDGNSMYPYLQNGDLVYFSSVGTKPIPNGTVIVFVQDATGASFLDSLMKPVLIHRIIGVEIHDGTVYYQTKGDNNQLNDPSLITQDHVLGFMSQDIPKVGLLILFLKSPMGLIATIGFVTIAYLSFFETKQKMSKQKDALTSALAQKTLNGVLPIGQFQKFELAIKNFDGIDAEGLKDKSIAALVSWLKEGNLEKKWKVKATTCNKCSGVATKFEGVIHKLTICPTCGVIQDLGITKVLHEEREPENLDTCLLEIVDDSLSHLGENAKKRIYLCLEQEFAIKHKDIPQRLDDFSFALRKLLGEGSEKLETMIKKQLKLKFPEASKQISMQLELSSYALQLKEEFEKTKLQSAEKRSKPELDKTSKNPMITMDA